jgi:hypothetical protein
MLTIKLCREVSNLLELTLSLGACPKGQLLFRKIRNQKGNTQYCKRLNPVGRYFGFQSSQFI